CQTQAYKVGFDIEIKDKKGAENLAADHLSRLENLDLGVFTEKETADEFLNEHLMMLKAKPNNDELWYADYVNYIVDCASKMDTEKEEAKSLKFWHTAILDQLGDITVPRLLEERLREDKDFKVGDRVLLFNFQLRMHLEITNKNGITFKVNGQRLKKYYDRHIDTEDKEVVEFNEDTTKEAEEKV
ncbi:hypothetical protein Tco_1464079, partial [Tanacetum coccineum]